MKVGDRRKMYIIGNIRKREYTLFAAAVVILTVLFIFIASGKRIQFCDEMFSYTITNSDSPLYQFRENEWYTNEEITNKLTHDSTDSLRQTIAMVKQDYVHPPLYYIMFYISSVFSGNHFSKWTGLFVNYIFFIGTVAFIWLIINNIFKSSIFAFVSVMIYGVNQSTLSNMTVVRMYMMMTFFLAAFVYINILIMNSRDNRNIRLYFWLGLVTAGGFLTQYYFALFGIMFFIIEAVYDCLNRRLKDILYYLGAMILAVILSTLIWNFWVEAILKRFVSSSMTGRNFNIFSNIPLMLDGLVIMQMSIFQWGYKVAEWAVSVLIIVFLAIPGIKKQYPQMKELVVKMTFTAVLYAGIVRYISPVNSTRYYYPVDMLEILIIIICVFSIMTLLQKHPAYIIAGVIMFAGSIFLTVNGFGIDYYGSGRTYDEQQDVLEQYGKLPYIIVGGETIEVSGSLSDFLLASEVIRITENYEANGQEVLGNIEKFIIVCQGEEPGGDDLADYGLYYYIVSTGKFARRQFLFRRNGLNYYLGYMM